MAKAEQLEAAILALQAQRAQLGDAVLELALAPLRRQLAELSGMPARAVQRIRQVSVLFADIVDSTALAEALDAEDYAAVLSEALSRWRRVVEAHQGRVTRFTGDGLKSVFGADGDQDDAPENAVRAGLALLAAAAAHADELRARGFGALRLRVGVHTGAAALGGGVEAENTATGSMVGIAARIEQAAEPGTLLISADTQRHVRGLFELSAREPLLAKGVTEPVITYRVQAARPPAARAARRGIAGVETPLIGRDAELGQLMQAFDAARAQRGLHALTLVGEAGVGKSRLLRELQQRIEARQPGVPLLAAGAQPRGRLQPYGLLRGLIASQLRIFDGDSTELARHKLQDGFAPALSAADAALLGQLIGLDFAEHPAVLALKNDPRVLRDRAFAASARWLRSRAETGGMLVLLFEDLHWADEASLEWLRHLLQAQRELPLLLLMATRAELLDRQPGWIVDTGPHGRIDLSRLDAAASAALAHSLLARLADIPPALRQLVVNGAEGNPFYMEELVKMLIDEGVIAVPGDAKEPWHVVVDKPLPARVPPTLTGVLQARLDALAERDRAALQQSAVIGPVFWEQALAALDPAAPASLAALGERQFVRRREGSIFDHSSELAFAHHLLHQVTYDTVLKSVRRLAHARAAAWLAEHVDERSRAYLAITAEHFERAGDSARAADYFVRAASDAESRYANDVAVEHARRALANLADDDVPGRFAMLVLIGRVLDVQGRRDAQQALYDEMEILAPPGQVSARRALLLFNRALLADRRGDFTGARQHAIEAVGLAEATQAWATAARANGEWAYVSAQFGEHALAREKAARALEQARRSGEVLAVAQALAIGGHVEWTSENLAQAVALFLEASVQARRHGLPRLEGLMQGNLGAGALALGDPAAAREHLGESLRIARELGNRSNEGTALCTLAEAELALGAAAAALDHARQSVALATALGDRYMRALSLLSLGDAQAASADPAAAAESYTLARTLLEAVAVPAALWLAAACQAELALALGEPAAALGHLAELLAAPADGDPLAAAPQAQRIRLVCHRVLSACGDERAASWLTAAHTLLQTQAVRLADPALRERFVQGSAHHRGIAAAWAAR